MQWYGITIALEIPKHKRLKSSTYMNNGLHESWAQNSLISGGKHNYLGKTSNIKDLNKPDIHKFFWKSDFCGTMSSKQW